MTPPAPDAARPHVTSAVARDQSLEISPDDLAGIVEAHDGMRSRLASVRARALPFVPAPIEPATALRWIERGGRSLGG